RRSRQLRPGRPRRRCRGADVAGQDPHQGARGHADRNNLPPQGQGRAQYPGLRHRRPACSRARGSAHAFESRAKSQTAGIRLALRRNRQPAQPGILREGKKILQLNLAAGALEPLTVDEINALPISPSPQRGKTRKPRALPWVNVRIRGTLKELHTTSSKIHPFYLSPEQCKDNTLTLVEREGHHAVNVLRVR